MHLRLRAMRLSQLILGKSPIKSQAMIEEYNTCHLKSWFWNSGRSFFVVVFVVTKKKNKCPRKASVWPMEKVWSDMGTGRQKWKRSQPCAHSITDGHLATRGERASEIVQVGLTLHDYTTLTMKLVASILLDYLRIFSWMNWQRQSGAVGQWFLGGWRSWCDAPDSLSDTSSLT